METAAVYILVAHVSAFSLSGVVMPEEPRFHKAYASAALCARELPAFYRAISAKLPAVASLNSVTCQRMEHVR